jgi:serine/threonine protein kinase
VAHQTITDYRPVPHFAHLLLGQILVDHHRLSPEAVEAGLVQQEQEQREKSESRFIGEILVERKVVTREQVAQALAFQREQFAQSMVGSYRLQSLLGRGGAGMVYRAVLLSGKSEPAPVALKLIPQRRPGDVDALARFQREAQAGTALDHPNIVRTLDFGTTRDSYWLVCELMSGGSLLERVRSRGLFEESDALSLALAMLQALDHALARGLVHRDIKPANILFDDQGSPHLADLGLVQFTQQDENGPRDRTAGTPAFIAPEQALGQDRYDTRSDLYSLGATLFFALTGAPPFIDPVPLEVINQHLNAAAPAVDMVNRNVSSDTAALIRKLLAKRCEDRYANPTEAIADVRRIQTGKRPLALALTPEQAYAPLKVQLQTRSGNKLGDHTPRNAAKNIQPTPTKAHPVGAVKTLTPRGNRIVTGPVNTPTPRGNRIAQQRPEVGRAQRAKKSGPWATVGFGGVSLIAVASGLFALVLWNRPPTAPLPTAGQQVEQHPMPALAAVAVDLISKLDAKKIQQEEWILRDGVLMSPRGAVHLLPIGWTPPAEYDLTCSFKRLYPSGSLSLIFDFNGRQCALVIGGDHDTRIGFELIGGKSFNDNESLHIIPEPLAQDKRMAVTIKVRRNGLSAHVGEKEICSLPGAGSNVKLDDAWKLPPNHVMGIGTRTTQVAVFRLNLTEFLSASSTSSITPTSTKL